MKRIDAHAHIGYTGGWANVGITGEELIAQMDQYEIEMTALCAEDNEVTYQMMQKYPGRIIGCVYVNPLQPESIEAMDTYFEKGFTVVKLNPLRHAYCADGALLDPVLEKAAKYQVPVCIHSGHPPTPSPGKSVFWQNVIPM